MLLRLTVLCKSFKSISMDTHTSPRTMLLQCIMQNNAVSMYNGVQMPATDPLANRTTDSQMKKNYGKCRLSSRVIAYPLK